MTGIQNAIKGNVSIPMSVSDRINLTPIELSLIVEEPNVVVSFHNILSIEHISI